MKNGANMKMTTETTVAWTQGPWQLHPRSPEISPQRVPGDEHGDGFDSWTARVSAGEKVVADVLGWTTTRGWGRADNAEEVLANARLIAAAPEMYEALREYVDLEQEVAPSMSRLCRLAIAALAKARGEQP